MPYDWGGIFPSRQQIEGSSPDTFDIGWLYQLTQNITKALAFDTYTLNHLETGSIFNFFDESTSTSLKWNGTAAAQETSTIILDLGIETHVHSTMFSFGLDCAVAENTKVTTSYSSDKSSWTQIDTDTHTAATESIYDHFLTATSFRYLKIVGETNAANGNVKLYKMRLIR